MVRTKRPTNFSIKRPAKRAVKKELPTVPTPSIKSRSRRKTKVKDASNALNDTPCTSKSKATSTPCTSTRVSRHDLTTSTISSASSAEEDGLDAAPDDLDLPNLATMAESFDEGEGQVDLTVLQKHNKQHFIYPYDFEIQKPVNAAGRKRMQRWRLKNLPENAVKYAAYLNKEQKRDMQPKRIYGRRKSEYSDAARAHIRELKLPTKYKSHDAVVQRNTAKHANRRTRAHAIVTGNQHLLKTATYNASHKKYESEMDFDELPSTSGHIDGRTEDSMKQSHDEVKAYINEFFRLIKPKYWFSEITKVVYLSDGAASQFKTRFNFWNLTYHQLDYGLPAEWHFFATSHGKGPCDAIGAVFKRTADGLTNFDQVTDLTTPIFTSLVGEQLNKTQVNYVNDGYIETVRQLNHERQKSMVATTPSQFMMLKSHYFQPTFQEIGQLKVSRHSCSCAMCIATPAGIHCPQFDTRVRTLSLVSNKSAIVEPIIPLVPTQPIVSPPPDRLYRIGQFVAAVYEGDWFVAEVRSLEKGEYFVQFFKKLGMNQFRACSPAEEIKEQCIINKKNMLCVVAPPAPSTSGRSSLLKLTENDYQRVLTAFMLHQDDDVFGSSDED